ncbi:unnamed protein product [Bursaphelenchus okinawaensis]|uniref:MARVEL domain-containing protein n=1 Tax=Bursaphelenchus okinawaensis TaxID=465554 RepID=A0A811KUD2_9BILA|nr:unnamed protein product [Bursaphelenchus okinawaensis]CAG9113382.1 unnamed protein product [Bursaphelenchus okinawaensis]
MAVNSHYLSTDRGVIKIIQIILGFVVCSVLCANWYGGASCFGEGRIGFVSGLNFVALIINIILFLLNLCEFSMPKLESLYNMIMTLMFVVAAVLFIWYMIQWGAFGIWMIVTAIIVVVMGLAFMVDANASRHQHQDHIPI